MRGILLLILGAMAISACGQSVNDSSLTPEEQQLRPAGGGEDAAPAAIESDGAAPDLGESPEPIAAEDAKAVTVQVFSESGYVNERKQYVIDVLERDYAYLSARVETPDGRPVRGAQITFATQGSSRVAGVENPAVGATTDENGMLEFGVVGGSMGLDLVKLRTGNATRDIVVNVISLKAAGYQSLIAVKGAVSWDDLMKARVRYEGEVMRAEFPASVAALSGKAIKLVGFMMPLDPDQKQMHFLLASNPPSCFFHVPGGPAGAIEVFADKGIEASWDPIALEGRFETVSRSELGVVYRLRDARVIKP